MNRYLTTVLAGALALSGSTLAGAQTPAPTPAKPAPQCFYSTDWNNWVSPDDHTMFIRVGVDRVYRLDFASGCQAMTWPNAHLITHIHGSNSICSPLDIDLKVSEGQGFAEPCIVSNLTQLSRAEISALPKGSKP
jgi:hypothetical protein